MSRKKKKEKLVCLRFPREKPHYIFIAIDYRLFLWRQRGWKLAFFFADAANQSCLLYIGLLRYNIICWICQYIFRQLKKLSEDSLTKQPEEVFDILEKLGEGWVKMRNFPVFWIFWPNVCGLDMKPYEMKINWYEKLSWLLRLSWYG